MSELEKAILGMEDQCDQWMDDAEQDHIKELEVTKDSEEY